MIGDRFHLYRRAFILASGRRDKCVQLTANRRCKKCPALLRAKRYVYEDVCERLRHLESSLRSPFRASCFFSLPYGCAPPFGRSLAIGYRTTHRWCIEFRIFSIRMPRIPHHNRQQRGVPHDGRFSSPIYSARFRAGSIWPQDRHCQCLPHTSGPEASSPMAVSVNAFRSLPDRIRSPMMGFRATDIPRASGRDAFGTKNSVPMLLTSQRTRCVRSTTSSSRALRTKGASYDSLWHSEGVFAERCHR